MAAPPLSLCHARSAGSVLLDRWGHQLRACRSIATRPAAWDRHAGTQAHRQL